MTDQVLRRACEEVLDRWARRSDPGVAVAVIRRGDAHYDARGLADLEQGTELSPASRFNVGSVSKQFTGACVGLAVEAGLLRPEDPVRDYLPELAPFADRITVEHLLRHTSGLRDCWELQIEAGWRNWDVMTHGDALEVIFAQREGNFRPASNWSYSNSGYVLLAEILQRVSGRGFRELAAEQVFEPLGMSSTHVQDDARELVPGRARSHLRDAEGAFKTADANTELLGTTGVFSSVEDLGRWAVDLSAGTVGGAALVERMTAPGRLKDGRPFGYGYGLFLSELDGHRTVEHGGQHGGSVTQLLHLPDEELSVVACANDLGAPVYPIATALARRVLGGGSARAAFEPAELAISPGVYRRSDSGFLTRIRVEDGSPRLGFGERSPLGIEPTVFFSAASPLAAIDADVPTAIVAGDDRERITFSADGKRLSTTSQGEAIPRTYERIEAPGATGEEDRDLGCFRCEELDASLRASLREERLRLEGRRFEPLALEAVSPSLFASAALTIELEGEAASPGALLLTSPAAWRVRFERCGEGGA